MIDCFYANDGACELGLVIMNMFKQFGLNLSPVARADPPAAIEVNNWQRTLMKL
jgi:hypothetical protein